MRPRHKAAENGSSRKQSGEVQHASMRPRHKAAENRPRAGGGARGGRACFNEAAA